MVNPLRVRNLTNLEYTGGTVVYQLCRDLRADDNDALLFAQELALKQKEKLIVTYVVYNYLWEGATRRFYDWVIPSLKEMEKELRKKNIPLVVVFQNENIFSHTPKEKIPSHIGAVVIEQIPLHFMDAWKDVFLTHNTHIPLFEVDAHNCIPVWDLSNKQEFAARTIRSKVHEKIPHFLENYSLLVSHAPNKSVMDHHKPINWDDIEKKIVCDESVKGSGIFIPGEKEAHKVLQLFLEKKLKTYDVSRNEIDKDGQSNLSPYIAHGNISRRRIIQELLVVTKIKIENAFDPVKNGSNKTMGSVAAFIEESVVRAELAENFCYYNKKYNKVTGFPAWAQETLKKASTDKREYIYTYKQFAEAKTHDDLWNAAQLQMVHTGKMHGYMRMYWAKKILEWSKSPKDALAIAIKLNDIYELDGREPNGYVGCAWSIGGVHDRPWFPRAIFGTIRYMAYSGVEKRGDVKGYIKKYLHGEASLF